MQSIVPPLQSEAMIARFCLCLILMLCGCQQPQQVLTFTPRSIDTAGPISIEVNSFAGNVTIIADDDARSTTIEVTQRDVGYNETTLDPKVSWGAWKESGDLGQIVKVNAVAIEDPLQTLHADILIRSKSIHGVQVVTSRGDVKAYGISGSIDIRTSDGEVRVATPLVINERVSIENIRGDIVMRIRGESSGTINATALNGSVSMNVRHGDAVILPKSSSDRVMAQLNNGANEFMFRTVDGDITISVVEDPIADDPWYSVDWLSW